MLSVRALSGEPVADIDFDSLRNEYSNVEELKGIDLKRALAKAVGCSRFQLKVLGDNNTVIDDDTPLTGPGHFTMVRMDYITDADSKEALVIACNEGARATVEKWLHAPVDPNTMDEREGRSHFSCLVLAAKHGFGYIAQLLVEAKADMNQQMEGGGTALHWAAFERRLGIVHLLVNANADVTIVDNTNAPASHMAARRGWADVVQVLEKEALSGTDQAGHTLVHHAAVSGSQATMDVVLELHGVDNLEAVTHYDLSTALHIGVQNNHMQVCRRLVDARANIDAAKSDGQTPVIVAAACGYPGMLHMLMQAGADIHKAMDSGWTALHSACESHFSTMPILLLEADADVNAANDRGRTPLHVAAFQGRRDTVQLLLEHGADKDAVDNEGDTALALCQRRNFVDVVQLLQEDAAAADAPVSTSAKRAKIG